MVQGGSPVCVQAETRADVLQLVCCLCDITSEAFYVYVLRYVDLKIISHTVLPSGSRFDVVK